MMIWDRSSGKPGRDTRVNSTHPVPASVSATVASGCRRAVTCPLLEGRDEAWIRCCTTRFLPLARSIAGDDATAHDILQESWISVLHGIDGFRGRPPACAWVRAVVRNEAVHQSTQLRRTVPLDRECSGSEGNGNWYEPPVDGASPEDAAHERRTVRLLLETVGRLPRTYRQIVRLRDIEERPPDEVAARLRISRSAVSSRLNRAHALLRRRFLAATRAPAGPIAPHPPGPPARRPPRSRRP